MSRTTFQLVLLVSCAHAMVHVYEQSLPSVEQMIGEDERFDFDDDVTSVTGALGMIWRIPFGVLAFLAGWLTDRFGAKPLLLIYLLGCVATSALAWWAPNLGVLFGVMFIMGCFASIYHPAGLALISHATTPENRSAALGWHGIFGSLGIAGAPFLAALFFSFSDGQSGSWRIYYLLLMIPGALLALVIWRMLKEHHRSGDAQDASSPTAVDDVAFNWPAYAVLVGVGTINGFIYASFTHFLARYLGMEGENNESYRTGLAAAALACGAVGQGLAGKFGRPDRLAWMLAVVVLANAPCLVWIALASGPMRIAATCVFAFVHFMNQPLYNSMLADYIPRRRRSLGYGFSNMMVFGMGGLGAWLTGMLLDRGPGTAHSLTVGDEELVAVLAIQL
ncbi:MAG: MFS transporter [Planctomycetes bacterium]|nr:MFS transporter [Planctomycetota bacterium]